jgi:hypothetical protein
MIVINLKNVEELIFQKAELRKLLPDLQHLFDQWHLSYRLPALGSLRTKSKLDLINLMSDEHIRVLEEYFQDSVVIDKLNYNIVKNILFPLDLERLGGLLSDVEGFANFTISRDVDKVYISMWR